MTLGGVRPVSIYIRRALRRLAGPSKIWDWVRNCAKLARLKVRAVSHTHAIANAMRLAMLQRTWSIGCEAIAEQMAVADHPVAIFSLEMGKQQLVQRMLCARGRIDSQRMRRSMLREDDFKRLMAACAELQEAPIYIDDTPGLSLLQLRSKARRLKDRHGISAIVIDYLQLMSAGGRVESRQLEVSEISRGVKAMARERVERGSFFGFISFNSLIARRP